MFLRYPILLDFGYCQYLYKLRCSCIWWLVSKSWSTPPAPPSRAYSVCCFFYKLLRVSLPSAGLPVSGENIFRAKKSWLVDSNDKARMVAFLLLVTSKGDMFSHRNKAAFKLCTFCLDCELRKTGLNGQCLSGMWLENISRNQHSPYLFPLGLGV